MAGRVEQIGDANHFRVGLVAEAADLVEAHHYSGRVPANLQCVGTWHAAGGLFGDQGPAIAACLFSIPPTRWSEDVWELCRLVRKPDVVVSLTGLISATVRYFHREKTSPGLLVSFADATQGHHGGIYQAASWNYAGQRGKCQDGLILNGTFYPGRSCNSRWGTRSPTRLAVRLPNHRIEPHWDDGKHLYWRALDKAGWAKARRLGLEALPYPKPQRPDIIRHAPVAQPPDDQRLVDLFAGETAA